MFSKTINTGEPSSHLNETHPDYWAPSQNLDGGK